MAKELSWDLLFEMIGPNWPRVVRSGPHPADMAVMSHGAITAYSQNLAKTNSPNTTEIMAVRARGILADSIWVAVAGVRSFQYRINLREMPDGTRHGQIWKLAPKGQPARLVAKYPDAISWSTLAENHDQKGVSRSGSQLTLPLP